MGHIAPLSFYANATIPAYRIVTCLTGTANTVKLPAAVSEIPVGITTDTHLDTTNMVPVAGPGQIVRCYFNDTVASGAFVASDSSGRGVPHVNVTAGSYVVGILVGPAVAATGTIADVYVLPMHKSIP